MAWIFFCPASQIKKTCSGDYPFISSEIDCGSVYDVSGQIESLHGSVQKIVDDEKNQGHIIRASVFYRDLNTRRWFGVNDLDKHYPASLIKLPVAIMYYKLAELDPGIFDREMQIPADMGDNSDQHYPPKDPLEPGKSYPVRELISRMLKYSDNAPFSTLSDNAGKVLRDKIFSDMGIYEPPAGEGEGAWNVNARDYANIFRMLYNASYVNINSANEILSILAQSTFTQGIVAGVPKDVKVAHKFGEAAGVDGNGNVQSLSLHDCGIVYKKDNPYILCIMTEGSDYPVLEKTIQRISKEAYDAL